MFIITGTVAYDYIMDFPGKYQDHILPDQLHNINLSFIVSKFEKRRGGTAGNVSYSLGLLNANHLLFTYAGHDFSDYQNSFKDLNVNLKGVHIDKTSYTSTGFAMTDKNNNQIWGFFYGASNKIETLKLKSVASKNDIVLIGPSGTRGTVSMLNQCIENKISYIFDPGFTLTDISNADLTRGVKNALYIIGNDYEVELIKTRVKNFDVLMKDKILVKTLGSKGSEIFEYGKRYLIKPSKVKIAVDPTGAGDAWRSGFIAGLLRKFDIKTCAQMGSVASAFVVEKYGAQEHKYTREQFKNRYRQTYKTLLDY